MTHTPDPHAHMPSYGMRCLRRGVATDAPLTKSERVGLVAGRTLVTTAKAARAIAIGLLIITGCWSWRKPAHDG